MREDLQLKLIEVLVYQAICEFECTEKEKNRIAMEAAWEIYKSLYESKEES